MTRENFQENAIQGDKAHLKHRISQFLLVQKDPVAHLSLRESKLPFDIVITPRKVIISFQVSTLHYPSYAPFIERTRAALKAAEIIPEGSKLVVVATEHNPSTQDKTQHHSSAKTAAAPPESKPPKKPEEKHIAGVKHIVAVASGKGGVGKSTTTVNLAYALRAQGYRVGILDADIYGPSVPQMLGLTDQPDAAGGSQKRMNPLEKDGIQVMSMGLLVDPDNPVIWRGPMVQKAVQQFLNFVDWHDVDVLLLDLPPGTGDIQLTLVQKARIDGAVIVTTPQDIACLDAKRAIGMFEKLSIPLIGVVENMAYHVCPKCKESYPIFAQEERRRELLRNAAGAETVKVIAQIPLHAMIQQMTDHAAQEALLKDPELGEAFHAGARAICAHCAL